MPLYEAVGEGMDKWDFLCFVIIGPLRSAEALFVRLYIIWEKTGAGHPSLRVCGRRFSVFGSFFSEYFVFIPFYFIFTAPLLTKIKFDDIIKKSSIWGLRKG